MNRTGFPSGKIHFGEELQDAANREVLEKTGLIDLPLKLRGNVFMRFIDTATSQAMNHIVGYVFSAEIQDTPDLKPPSEHWRAFWGDESQLIDGNVFKGHKDILELLNTKKQFIASFDYESDF